MTTIKVRARVKLTEELQKSILEGVLDMQPGELKLSEIEGVREYHTTVVEPLIAKYVDAEGYATLEFESFRGARILPLSGK